MFCYDLKGRRLPVIFDDEPDRCGSISQKTRFVGRHNIDIGAELALFRILSSKPLASRIVGCRSSGEGCSDYEYENGILKPMLSLGFFVATAWLCIFAAYRH